MNFAEMEKYFQKLRPDRTGSETIIPDIIDNQAMIYSLIETLN